MFAEVSTNIFLHISGKFVQMIVFFLPIFTDLFHLTFDKFFETNIGGSEDYHPSPSKPPLDVSLHGPRVHVGVKSTSFKVAEKDTTQLIYC